MTVRPSIDKDVLALAFPVLALRLVVAKYPLFFASPSALSFLSVSR